MRATHYDESDVYICESVYDESRRQIGPLPPTGLKTYEHSSLDVLADEVYYFKSPINVQKVSELYSYCGPIFIKLPIGVSNLSISKKI